jgi:tetratricopeptide (TPR) repeat protein
VSESLDQEIRTLRAQFWARRDPEGRAFAPLADAYRRRGELDEAVSLIRDGLARIPDYATGHLVASRVARDRGHLPEARSHLDRVLDLDPENVSALLDRAEMGLEEGDRDGALRDLRALLSLEPGNEEARVWLEAVEEAELLERREAPAPEPEATPELEAAPEPEAIPHPAPENPAPEPEGSAEEDPDALAEIEVPDLEIQVPDLEVDAPGPEIAELLGEPPPPDADPQERGLRTRTMADLYARQGLHERAVEVYRHLVEQDPGNRELEERLQSLLAATRGASGSGSTAPPRLEADDEVEGAPDGSAGAGSGRTISRYLGDLLAWVPGAVPIESLAPESTGDLPGEGGEP